MGWGRLDSGIVFLERLVFGVPEPPPWGHISGGLRCLHPSFLCRCCLGGVVRRRGHAPGRWGCRGTGGAAGLDGQWAGCWWEPCRRALVLGIWEAGGGGPVCPSGTTRTACWPSLEARAHPGLWARPSSPFWLLSLRLCSGPGSSPEACFLPAVPGKGNF